MGRYGCRMTAYKVMELGALDTWQDFEGPIGKGKRFIDWDLETKYAGMSSNAADAGQSSPYWHTHSKEEELYIFLSGKGQMGVNDDVVDVEAGSVVRVSPGTWSSWRCMPDSPEQMRFLVVRAGGEQLPRIGHDATIDRERPLPWA